MVTRQAQLHLETLADVRAEIARRKLSQDQIATALGATGQRLSHLMYWEDDVQLTDKGARRFAEAIASCDTTEAKSK